MLLSFHGQSGGLSLQSLRGFVRGFAGRCGRRERDFTEREEVPLGCIVPYGAAVRWCGRVRDDRTSGLCEKMRRGSQPSSERKVARRSRDGRSMRNFNFVPSCSYAVSLSLANARQLLAAARSPRGSVSPRILSADKIRPPFRQGGQELPLGRFATSRREPRCPPTGCPLSRLRQHLSQRER